MSSKDQHDMKAEDAKSTFTALFVRRPILAAVIRGWQLGSKAPRCASGQPGSA